MTKGIADGLYYYFNHPETTRKLEFGHKKLQKYAVVYTTDSDNNINAQKFAMKLVQEKGRYYKIVHKEKNRAVYMEKSGRVSLQDFRMGMLVLCGNPYELIMIKRQNFFSLTRKGF